MDAPQVSSLYNHPDSPPRPFLITSAKNPLDQKKKQEKPGEKSNLSLDSALDSAERGAMAESANNDAPIATNNQPTAVRYGFLFLDFP